MASIKNFIKNFIKRFTPSPKANENHRELLSRLNKLEEKNNKLHKALSDINSFHANMLRIQQQPRLKRLQLHIVEHCNLNCKGCSVFSPIAKEYFVSLECIQNDLVQLSRLTDGKITQFDVLGGEPLLHPKLQDILSTLRRAFPKSAINLVTNGVLLLNLDDTFWTVCKECNVVIEMTRYPINLNIDKIIELAALHEVKFDYRSSSGVKEKKFWKIPLDVSGLQDSVKNFWHCHRVNFCPVLKEGKLYPCTLIPAINVFNCKFGANMEIEQDDFLDIYDPSIGYKDILSFVSTPKPFCRHCKTPDRINGLTWEQSKQDINEWI